MGQRNKSMRLLAIAALVLGITISGLAQKSNAFKVKSTPEKAPRQSAPMGKTGASNNTATANNAKNLQAIERANTKVPAASRSGHKAAGKNATGLKPVKNQDKNPPINAGGGSGKGTGLISKGSNPMQGRLKQKGKKN
jgi:hypothetical protein